MAFWSFMLAVDLLIPLTMIGFGRHFQRTPPKEINSTFGYRTRRSMRNWDTWAFAHRYFGRLWFVWGWILLPLTVLALLPFLGASPQRVGTAGTVVCLLQLIPMGGVIFPTERALKRTFDDQGRRR